MAPNYVRDSGQADKALGGAAKSPVLLGSGDLGAEPPETRRLPVDGHYPRLIERGGPCTASASYDSFSR